MSRNELAKKLQQLRTALNPKATSLGDIPAFDVALAHELYNALLAPISEIWQSAKRLFVVAEKPLGMLPFATLVTKPTTRVTDTNLVFAGYRKVAWLNNSHAITSLPSIASLEALRGKKNRPIARKPFLGFGDPIFDLRKSKILSSNVATRSGGFRAPPKLRGVDIRPLSILPQLPDTRTEILEIAKVLGADLKTDIYLGERASEKRLRALNASERLKKYKILSFATHGLVPGDLDGLTKPALALTPSQRSAMGSKGDGLITTDEIVGLSLSADIVVLSALQYGCWRWCGR